MVQATCNAKQIYMLLAEFDQEYGKFPDASTAANVTTKTGSTIPLGGSSSNAYLRQLLAAEYLNVESIFFAKTKQCRKPDDNISGPLALAPNECGFAYLAGFSLRDDADIPILVTPLIPGTTTFDRKPHEGKAVILRIDGSVRAEAISKDGHVYLNGMDIFDPKQPYWGGKTPVISYPE